MEPDELILTAMRQGLEGRGRIQRGRKGIVFNDDE